MSKQPLVIYHGNCPDGFTAAWCAHQTERWNGAEFFPAHYNSGGPIELPAVDGRAVLILDFCPKRPQLLDIHARAASLRVLDHHKTAEADCDGLDFCTFDMERSGAGLAWDELVDGPTRPWLVDYVEDRDLWRFKLPDSEAINAYIRLQPMAFGRWSEMAWRETASQVAVAGAGAQAYVEHYVREMVKLARWYTIDGESIMVVNAPYLSTSELVGELAGQSTFAVGWFQAPNGRFRYSLRSRDGFDVGAFAASMGGGGHAAAAGFESDEPPWALWSPAAKVRSDGA